MKTSDNKCQGIREKVATTINLAGPNKQKVQKAADAKEWTDETDELKKKGEKKTISRVLPVI